MRIPFIDISDWPTMVSALAAAIGTFLTYFTVKSMEKQRKQSYMPNLVFKSLKRFYLYKGINEDDYQYWIWNESEVKNEQELTSMMHYRYYLDLYNIGVGTAKSVKFSYQFNTDEIKKFFEEIDILKFNKLEIEKDPPDYEANFENYKFGGGSGFNDLIFEKVFIPHSNSQSVDLRLPAIYLALFNCYTFSILFKENHWNYWNKFPSMKLKVDYYDIGNVQYYQIYEIKFIIDGYANVRGPARFAGRIEIKEQSH